MLVVLLLVAVGLASSSILDGLSARGRLAQLADVLGWTPLGPAWSAPADVVDRRLGSGLLRLALAAAFLACALRSWDVLLRGALENPRATSGAVPPAVRLAIQAVGWGGSPGCRPHPTGLSRPARSPRGGGTRAT